MVLGVFIGVLAGAVVLGFRVAIAEASHWFTLGQGFAGIPWQFRLVLPMFGGLAVGLLVKWVFPRNADVGVSRVLERVAYGASQLGARSAVAQFLFGILAIGSGHSVGREGPSVHMGAAVGSLIGQRAGVDPDHLRILVAAGAAGAFAGALDVPLAGVVFALEVILGEYSLVLFAPVVVSAVIATVIAANLPGGREVFLQLPDVTVHSFWFLPLDWVIGLGAALVAFLLIRGVETIHRASQWVRIPGWALPGVGGLGVGSLAVFLPEVMGVSYDALSAVFAGSLSVGFLTGLLAAKLAATAISLGTQSRGGGAIGPALFMGALLGAIAAGATEWLFPIAIEDPASFAIVGMAAGMASVLNAPFSAIVAVFELTQQPAVILPVMLATVTAAVTSRDWFKAEAIFAWTLHLRELSEPSLPEAGQKCTVPVNEVMIGQYRILPPRVDPEELREAQSDSGLQVIFPVFQDSELVGILDLNGLLRAGVATPDDDGCIDLSPYLYREEELRPLFPGDRAVKAMDLMASYGLEGYPVRSPRDAHMLVGLVYQTDVIQACMEQLREHRNGEAPKEASLPK